MPPFLSLGFVMSLIRAACLSLALLAFTACNKAPPPAPKAAPAASTAPAAPVADAAAVEAADIAALRARIDARHPDIAAIPYRASRVPGSDLYEIVTANGVLYTDKNAGWFLYGSMSYGAGKSPDGQPGVVPYTRRPAMQMLMASLSGATPVAADPQASADPQVAQLLSGDMSGRQMFDALPMDAGFLNRIGSGPAPQKVAIFEDPDCPFCQAFHQELKLAADTGKLAGLNVELVSFPYILSDRHPNALKRARAIACAPQPASAWNKWMLAAAQAPKAPDGSRDLDALWELWSPINAPGPGDCSRAALVDAWQLAGKQMKFMATPTFLFADGSTIEGQVSPVDLKEMVAVAAANRARQPASAGGPLGSGADVSSQAAAALRDLTQATLSPEEPAAPKPKP
jgi:protein-disulfide isomerase